MPEERTDVYTAYADDNTYWTLRKKGRWYLVSRRRSGTYADVERYGWYRRAGAAATAVGLLSYLKGLADGQQLVRTAIQQKLDELGMTMPEPELVGEEPGEGEFEDE